MGVCVLKQKVLGKKLCVSVYVMFSMFPVLFFRMAEYRLSLVAQYDDLVRNGRVLTQGIEAGRYIAYTKPVLRND